MSAEIAKLKEEIRILRQENDKYSRLLGMIPGMIYQYQLNPDNTSRMPFTSNGIMEIFELLPDYVKEDASVMMNLVHPEDKSNFAASIYKSREKNTVWDEEFRVLLPDKGERWIKGYSQPEQQSSGICIWHGYMQDISDRKKTDQLLMEAKLNAEAASIAKSQFLANVSHEIRTPMNGILGFMQLLEMTDPTEEQMEYIENMKVSSDILLRVINDILDISKIEANKLEIESIPFDLRHMISLATMPYRELFKEKKVDFITEIATEIPNRLIGDPARIRQVLGNLLNNALKFTDFGNVKLQVRAAKHAESCTVQPAVCLEFSVTDTGVGIPASSLGRIFEPFIQGDSSTTRKYGGTGLGLSICKKLVEAMGGKIIAESTVGKGTTVLFSVALAKSPEYELTPRVDHSLLKGTRILVYAKSQTDKKTIRTILEESACMVIEVSHFDEIISLLDKEKMEKNKISCDLIILETTMENQMVYGLLSKIGTIANGNQVPVFLVANKPSRGEASWAKEFGFTGYLSKPYTKKEFLDTIAMTISQNKKRLANAQAKADPVFITRYTANEIGTAPVKIPRVLVVEDDETNIALIRKVLEIRGFHADVAHNGIESVEKSMENPYNLILMDCQMPIMDGYTATREIRNGNGPNKKTPIVAVTAHVLEGDPERCYEAGMNGYISKPIVIEEIYKVLEEFLK